jgi:hypothetical protein
MRRPDPPPPRLNLQGGAGIDTGAIGAGLGPMGSGGLHPFMDHIGRGQATDDLVGPPAPDTPPGSQFGAPSMAPHPNNPVSSMSPGQSRVFGQMSIDEKTDALASLQPPAPGPDGSGGIGLMGTLGIANLGAGIGSQIYSFLTRPKPQRQRPNVPGGQNTMRSNMM